MSGNRWGMTYEGWERHAVPATTETVREAMSYERQGWPMPISGDLTLQGWTAATHCSCDMAVPLVNGKCGICGLIYVYIA